MKKITLTLHVIRAVRIAMALTIIIAMASCSREKMDAPVQQPQTGNKKLMQATYVYNNGAPENQTYSYDGTGRLSGYIAGDRIYNFSYIDASLLNITRKKNSDGAVDQTIEYTLNSNGAITKMVFKKADGAVTQIKELTYNADGYLTNEKGYNTGYTYEEAYVIENGNAVSSKLYYDGVLYNSRLYYYDLSKTNKAPFNHATSWPSQQQFGKPSKNIQTEYKDFNQSGTLTWHTKQTSQTDAAGFPEKVTTDFILQGTQSVANYTFQ